MRPARVFIQALALRVDPAVEAPASAIRWGTGRTVGPGEPAGGAAGIVFR